MNAANLNGTQKKIIEAGKELAKVLPDCQELKNAREWWAAGRLSLYSNHDFDILQSLSGALLSYKHGRRA